MPIQILEYEVTLRAEVKDDDDKVVSPGRTAVIRQLTISQLHKAVELAEAGSKGDAKLFRQKLMGLRLSLVELDGKKLTYNETQGSLLDQLLTGPECLLLANAYGQINEASLEDVERVKNSVKVRTPA